MQTTIRIIFWLIALISLMVAAVWYYNEPTFEPLLALLGALPAILEQEPTSFVIHRLLAAFAHIQPIHQPQQAVEEALFKGVQLLSPPEISLSADR